MNRRSHDESVSAESGAVVDPVWIVVPAYQEARRLGRVLETLLSRYSHVVVVDDGSSDGTFEAAGAHRVWRLRHLLNCGQGAALQTGIDFALARGAQTIVTFDADGQHQLDDVERLIEPLRRDEADVVLGSRFLGSTENMPWSRWCVLKAGVWFTRCFSRVAVTDAHNGLRAFSRRAAGELKILENRMAHASEIIDQIRRRGWRYVEAPVTVRYTTDSLAKGQSSWAAVRIASSYLLGKLIP